jgi:hypothetical protein
MSSYRKDIFVKRFFKRLLAKLVPSPGYLATTTFGLTKRIFNFGIDYMSSYQLND